MSQKAGMSARVRAFVVFGAICAVTIGLLAPAFLRPVLQTASGSAVECPHHLLAKGVMSAAEDGAASHAPRPSGFPGCPDCCLAAAHLGKAVLAFRNSYFSRLEGRVASRIRYADYTASAVKPVAAEPANGARAPPAA
ncbi:hypothetical protein DSM21852_25500 [Methylocystis bryophila]|uniref:DUF2946 domain-containing protein n=2 Tax=Methylocystis bryophila TaxID=655015 RepID=A0A1W6MZK3_9HYPH|nr:hypothetical protein B1812_20095 [Methylocystis bryophila]BDV39297.1 hypothetical protein DSM21852_25500 [Methylocystis bryophila]